MLAKNVRGSLMKIFYALEIVVENSTAMYYIWLYNISEFFVVKYFHYLQLASFLYMGKYLELLCVYGGYVCKIKLLN